MGDGSATRALRTCCRWRIGRSATARGQSARQDTQGGTLRE
ncbi:hypothetical protein TI01_0254 [Lysobacter sp. A03]|nr:hypothetical protein TI01_0254 [Lysobacter sp. A03]